MAATVTVTGQAGAGLTVTAAVFTNVTSFTIDTDKNILSMTQGSVVIAPIAIPAATSITATKSGSVYTLTIS
jgi:hypothetical protein